MDHQSFLASIPVETRTKLTRTSNAPGLWHLSGHLGIILALMAYVGFGLPLWPVALPFLGVALVFLFTLQHECTHKTPFATPWLNTLVGHATGFLIVQPFQWFVFFHMAHHRHTNDPEHDPELAERKPETWAELAWHLGTLGFWADKLRVLTGNALNPTDANYVPSRHRSTLQREARLYLVGYAGLALASILWLGPLLLWLWILPLALGFPVLRLYLMAEHGRCPAVADMFWNTRTTLAGRGVRFLAWNMPYHAEHHAWPAVPFHRLPDVHDLARPHLKSVSESHVQFTRETLADLAR